MKAPECGRIALSDLTDYAAGELPDAAAAAIEKHLFSCADCGARAAEFDALVRAIPPAVRSGEVAGFVTDAVLNRLARDGVGPRGVANARQTIEQFLLQSVALLVEQIRGAAGEPL